MLSKIVCKQGALHTFQVLRCFGAWAFIFSTTCLDIYCNKLVLLICCKVMHEVEAALKKHICFSQRERERRMVWNALSH